MEKLDFLSENNDELLLGEMMYDSRERLVNSTSDLYDTYEYGTNERTFTCFASDIQQHKLISKTKLLIARNGELKLTRFIYSDKLKLPVRIIEYGSTSAATKLDVDDDDDNQFKVFVDKNINESQISWHFLNGSLIQRGSSLKRSTMTAVDQVILLKIALNDDDALIEIRLARSNFLNDLNFAKSQSSLQKVKFEEETDDADDDEQAAENGVVELDPSDLKIEMKLVDSESNLRLDGRLTIDCFASDPYAEILWSKVSGSTSESTFIYDNRLIIDNINLNDLATYKCTARNREKKRTRRLSLTLLHNYNNKGDDDKLKLNIEPMINIETSHSDIDYGKQLQLRCDSSDDGDVVWSAVPDKLSRHSIDGKQLTIESLAVDTDLGLFECSFTRDNLHYATTLDLRRVMATSLRGREQQRYDYDINDHFKVDVLVSGSRVEGVV